MSPAESAVINIGDGADGNADSLQIFVLCSMFYLQWLENVELKQHETI